MPKQSYEIITIYQIKKYINSNKEMMASTPPVAFEVVMEAKELLAARKDTIYISFAEQILYFRDNAFCYYSCSSTSSQWLNDFIAHITVYII